MLLVPGGIPAILNVIPAQAGISGQLGCCEYKIPACAGMTRYAHYKIPACAGMTR